MTDFKCCRDQPERFDAPEMEVDLPDMEGGPFMATPEAEHELHRTSEVNG